MGEFRAQLREDLVPVTTENFIDLTNDEFYDDFIFHRVISEFMIQDGCPNGNGTGGPGYTFLMMSFILTFVMMNLEYYQWPMPVQTPMAHNTLSL